MKLYNLSRLDAAQNVFFSRDLESIDPQEYINLIPGRLARRYIPALAGVPPYANVYTYRMYQMMGRTKAGSKHGNDSPRASLTGVETPRKIVQLENHYSWTTREIEQAAATGAPLDRLTVLAAMSATEQKIDDMLALGDSAHGITGLLNDPIVDDDVLTPTTKTGGPTWATSGNTGDQVLADLNKITMSLVGQLKSTDAPGFQKFTILVPTQQYAYLATTPRGTGTDTTLLQFALRNNPWIEAIEPWDKCDGAGSGPSDRMVAYARNPMCLGALVPDEFRAHAPQERGLEVYVPTTASCGGTVIRYPVAVKYMDGI
jgi:hypothetical protein